LTTNNFPQNACIYLLTSKLFVCCLMVFNATFNNISVISWRSVLLVEETGGPGENHWPVASHWQTLSHNVVHLAMIEIWTHNISGDTLQNYKLCNGKPVIYKVQLYFFFKSHCLLSLQIWPGWAVVEVTTVRQSWKSSVCSFRGRRRYYNHLILTLDGELSGYKMECLSIVTVVSCTLKTFFVD
jgi:hypothetical protein